MTEGSDQRCEQMCVRGCHTCVCVYKLVMCDYKDGCYKAVCSYKVVCYKRVCGYKLSARYKAARLIVLSPYNKLF